MTQNADLLAPSVNTGIGGNAPFTWNNADWHTTAALSRRTSEARLDTRLFNLQIALGREPIQGAFDAFTTTA